MNTNELTTILEKIPHCKYKTDISASELTTFQIGGNISLVFFPENRDELIQAGKFCHERKIPYRIIGAGSNVLASDEGFDGVWILTERCCYTEVRENHVEVSTGVKLNDLINLAIEKELAGLENLYGIPGSVGGAIFMNAGAFGTSFSDLLVAVDVYDISRDKIYSLPYEKCGFSYRKSMFQKGGYIILGASLRLAYSRSDIVKSRARSVSEKRLASQPCEFPSAGSIFRRPRDHYAGKLIGDAGFSGYRVGGACVSAKHNGFIINLGNATCQDVKTIIADIRKRIFETKGILLQTEIMIE